MLRVISLIPPLLPVRPSLTHDQMASLRQEVAFLSGSQWPRCCLLNLEAAHRLGAAVSETFRAGLGRRPVPRLTPGEANSRPGRPRAGTPVPRRGVGRVGESAAPQRGCCRLHPCWGLQGCGWGPAGRSPGLPSRRGLGGVRRQREAWAPFHSAACGPAETSGIPRPPSYPRRIPFNAPRSLRPEDVVGSGGRAIYKTKTPGG